jgi:hypothetical protein
VDSCRRRPPRSRNAVALSPSAARPRALRRRLSLSNVAHKRPHTILVFGVIETAQLPGHSQCQMQETPWLSSARDHEGRAERSHIEQPRHLCPFKADRLPAHHTQREVKLYALAHALWFSVESHCQRRFLSRSVWHKILYFPKAALRGRPGGRKLLKSQDFSSASGFAKKVFSRYNMSCLGRIISALTDGVKGKRFCPVRVFDSNLSNDIRGYEMPNKLILKEGFSSPAFPSKLNLARDLST